MKQKQKNNRSLLKKQLSKFVMPSYCSLLCQMYYILNNTLIDKGLVPINHDEFINYYSKILNDESLIDNELYDKLIIIYKGGFNLC